MNCFCFRAIALPVSQLKNITMICFTAAAEHIKKIEPERLEIELKQRTALSRRKNKTKFRAAY